jgi:hypothetical protein
LGVQSTPDFATDVTFEQLLGQWLLLRWSNSATLSQEFNGLEWGSELSVIRHFSANGAFTLTGGAYGTAAEASTVSTYRVLVQQRWRFLRDWLFLELEPEVSWTRSETGDYAPIYAGTLRLEVVFAGSVLKTGH